VKNDMTLDQAIDGFLLDANARRLSPRTITDYHQILLRFLDHVGDVTVRKITCPGYLTHPRGFERVKQPFR
jgi:hypothetical protein